MFSLFGVFAPQELVTRDVIFRIRISVFSDLLGTTHVILVDPSFFCFVFLGGGGGGG